MLSVHKLQLFCNIWQLFNSKLIVYLVSPQQVHTCRGLSVTELQLPSYLRSRLDCENYRVSISVLRKVFTGVLLQAETSLNRGFADDIGKKFTNLEQGDNTYKNFRSNNVANL